MSFLPIVERELRVASRKRSTYRTRTWFVLGTSALAGMLLVIGNYASGSRVGASVFSVLSGLAFLFCLIAGPRYSADCLSEEKREGTLGLLFLTDLRGYDVIFGKLVSASTQTLPGLMAFFPVLSIALLLGGNHGWRVLADEPRSDKHVVPIPVAGIADIGYKP